MKCIKIGLIKDEKGFYAVEYTAIIPLLVEGIKKQQEEINSIKQEVLELDILKIDFASISSNQSTQIITSYEIRKIANLVNTAKNDLISAEEIYYYKFI